LIPFFCIEAVEGFIVVTAEFRGGLALELRELLAVPEDEVIGKLADGMVTFAVGPTGLLGSESINSGIRRDKPFGFVVRGTQLFEQDALEGRRRFLICGKGG